jgi:hypothetical protein
VAIVNYSVPDEVKKAFDAAFAQENKSAVVARLMRDAVEERRRIARRRQAVAALLDLRKRTKPVRPGAIRVARRRGRP